MSLTTDEMNIEHEKIDAGRAGYLMALEEARGLPSATILYGNGAHRIASACAVENREGEVWRRAAFAEGVALAIQRMERREIDPAADDIEHLAEEFAEEQRAALFDALTVVDADPDGYI